MYWISLCFAFVITTNIVVSRTTIISKNGWKPLTYEEVFRGFIQPKQKLQTFWPYKTNVDAIKLVNPHVFAEFTINNEGSYPEKTIQGIQPTIGLPDAVNNCGTKDTKSCLVNSRKKNAESLIPQEKEKTNNKIIMKPQREAKKISVESSEGNDVKINHEDNGRAHDKSFKADTESKGEELQEAETDLYKVIEEENIVEQLPTSRGYVYEKPPIKLENPNNITDTFLKILSKYNIKVNEESDNYKISRKPRTKTVKTRPLFYLPIPLTLDQNRMDLHHLLAVFLSNYGYYLPGFYGPANKYRNLYGSLAANNIHNNKPFGLYKVFADNDSSN